MAKIHEGRGARRLGSGRQTLRQRHFFVLASRSPISVDCRPRKSSTVFSLFRLWRPRESEPEGPLDLLFGLQAAVIEYAIGERLRPFHAPGYRSSAASACDGITVRKRRAQLSSGFGASKASNIG